jgi:hypothetical protein
MHRTLFEIRDRTGKRLDAGNFTNCPDLADTRINRCLHYYPDASVERVDVPDWHEGDAEPTLAGGRTV